MTKQKYHHGQPESRIAKRKDHYEIMTELPAFEKLSYYQQMHARTKEGMTNEELHEAAQKQVEEVERERESTRFAYHIQKENPEMSNREARRLARREYAYSQGKEYHPRFKSRTESYYDATENEMATEMEEEIAGKALSNENIKEIESQIRARHWKPK